MPSPPSPRAAWQHLGKPDPPGTRPPPCPGTFPPSQGTGAFPPLLPAVPRNSFALPATHCRAQKDAPSHPRKHFIADFPLAPHLAPSARLLFKQTFPQTRPTPPSLPSSSGIVTALLKLMPSQHHHLGALATNSPTPGGSSTQATRRKALAGRVSACGGEGEGRLWAAGSEWRPGAGCSLQRLTLGQPGHLRVPG